MNGDSSARRAPGGPRYGAALDRWCQDCAIGVQFVDIPLRLQQKAPVRFTFLWLEESRWEGKDYVVEVQASVAEAQARRQDAA